MPRKPPDTSMAAWRSVHPDMLSAHHATILHALAVLKRASAEQISSRVELSYAQVSRRMSELELKELVIKAGKTKTLTGRAAYLYKLAKSPKPKPAQIELFTNN